MSDLVTDQPTPNVVPVGTIMMWPGPENTIPDGWLICDGSEVSKSQFSDLFDVLGTTWNNADTPGETSNLPDLRGQFVRGVNGTSDTDPDVGSRVNNFGNGSVTVGSLQSDAVHDHNHNYTIQYGSLDASAAMGNSSPGGEWWGLVADYEASNTAITPNYTSGEVGGAANVSSNETRPRNVYLYFIIFSGVTTLS